jgi:hypothetical protein
MSASVRSKCVVSRIRFIFSVMVVAVFSVVLLVGCGNDDDDGNGGDGSGGIVGDWLLVGDEYGRKAIFSFKASGDFVLTDFDRVGNFWIEFVEGVIKYTVKNISMCLVFEYDGEEEEWCNNYYSISGDTLTIDIEGMNGVMKGVRNNIATFRSSLGDSLKILDPALERTSWKQLESEYDIQFQFSRYDEFCNGPCESEVYISRSDVGTYWYTEGGNRLMLLSAKCDRYETMKEDDYEWERCVSQSVDKTVTLDYELSNNNKTLRLRPVGATEWDVWTKTRGDGMSKSRAKSTQKKGIRAVSSFKDLLRFLLH